MDGGRSRIDIISNNIAGGGLFSEYKSVYRAITGPMECKNYGTELGHAEFNQIMKRLSPKTSQLGMMFCRSITDVPSIIGHHKDRFLRHGCMILLFDDHLVEHLSMLRFTAFLQRDRIASPPTCPVNRVWLRWLRLGLLCPLRQLVFDCPPDPSFPCFCVWYSDEVVVIA